MRKKGIIFLVVLVGVFFLLSLLLTDKWLEKRLEGLGTAVVGAKVEIDNLDFSIFGMHMKWDSLQVTNPRDTWRNILSTGDCEFNMSFLPLLSGKVVIEEFQATNLRSGLQRSSDGKIPKKLKKKSTEPTFLSRTIRNLENEVEHTAVGNLGQLSQKINVDSIFAILEIQSPEKIDSLKNEMQTSYDQWNETLTHINVKSQLEEKQNLIKEIEPTKISSVTELTSALSTVEKVRTEIDSLQNFLGNTRSRLDESLDLAKTSVTKVDDWVEDDFRRALAKAKLPDLNQKSIGKILFGKKLVDQYSSLLGFINQTRYYAAKFKSDKPEKEKPPRFAGQNIYFPVRNAVPKFWIKNIDISGKTFNSILFSGKVTDIVSNQNLIGKFTKFNISGSQNNLYSLAFNGDLNYLGEKPEERFQLSMAEIPMSNIKLSESAFLPYKLNKGRGAIQATMDLNGETLDGNVRFSGNELVFDLKSEEKQPSRPEAVVRSIFNSTSVIDFNARIFSDNEKTQFSLNSNLDDLFVQKLRSEISSELESRKEALKTKISNIVEEKRQNFIKFSQEYQAKLDAELGKHEALLEETMQKINDKKAEIEARIDDEKNKQKKNLEDKAKSKIKGIFGS